MSKVLNKKNVNDKFHAPRKSLGQNFLQDDNIIRKIVESVSIKKEDTVIEIGPGRGALTEHILPLTRHCHVIEFDRDLIEYWQQRAESSKNLTVHPYDILKFDLQSIIDDAPGDIKVIGNLPYNISSPVLFYLRKYAQHIDSQIVMLQKEVVERMASKPGSKQFGRLSVMLQQRYAIEYLFTVPPTAFYPSPKVESAIARLSPLQQVAHRVDKPEVFAKVVKQAFSMRRKTLRNNLKGLLDVGQIESLEIDPGTRAERLTVRDFVALSNLYSSLLDF